MADQCSCCKALWVKFYLIQPLSNGDDKKLAKVYFDAAGRQFWQGEDPDPEDEGFFVYNLEETLGLVPMVYQFEGEVNDIGIACLDESDPSQDRYRIVALGQDNSDLVHFELTYDLTLGGSATAVVLSWNGAAWVATAQVITVYDWYTQPGMWQGYIGYRGFAVRSKQSQRHEIIWMETRARSIEFTLNQNLSSQGAGATVTKYYLQGKNPGQTVTVYDDQGNYPHALSGAKGKARWNDQQRRYEIVECNQMAISLSCTLGADLCPDDSDAVLVNQTVNTFPPYGQAPNPLPATATNTYKLAGKSGNWCLVMWDETHELWEVVQVQHRKIEFITKIRYKPADSGSGCSIQVKRWEVAVMTCKEEGDWNTEIPLVDNEYVDQVRFTGCEGESGAGSGGGGSMKIQYHSVKVCMFESPKPQSWHDVLTFQEQYVVTAIAGSGSCLSIGGRTVATPCIGELATSQVCATAQSTCTCSCNCGSGSGSGGGPCVCSCQCQTIILF